MFFILLVGKGEIYKLGFVEMFKYEKCKLCPCINCKLCGCIIHNTKIFCSKSNAIFYIIFWLTVVGANIVRPFNSKMFYVSLSYVETKIIT